MKKVLSGLQGPSCNRCGPGVRVISSKWKQDFLSRSSTVFENPAPMDDFDKEKERLYAIIDVHSRYVVGWGLFNDLRTKNCLMVLKDAIRQNGKPEFINSDQGSQFTCPLWVEFS